MGNQEVDGRAGAVSEFFFFSFFFLLFPSFPPLFSPSSSFVRPLSPCVTRSDESHAFFSFNAVAFYLEIADMLEKEGM